MYLPSGLCHSDYHIIIGDLAATPLPALLGHEVSGIIEAVGENVPWLKPGDYVTTCLTAHCGHCRECQTGHTYLCDAPPGAPTDRPSGSRVTKDRKPIYVLANHGGFAEEMVVHHRAVVKLPKAIPPEAAALLCCAVLTGVGSVLNGAKVEPGSTVAVIGCGGVGLNVIQGARIADAGRIIAIDINETKLALARQFGATDTPLSGPDLVKEIQDLTGGGVDYAFEVIGLPCTMRQAYAMLRKRGTAVMVGVAKSGSELSVPIFPLAFKGTKITGTFMGNSPFPQFLPQLAQHYLSGRLKLDELVSARLPLAQINEGYARMAAGEVARSVVMF